MSMGGTDEAKAWLDTADKAEGANNAGRVLDAAIKIAHDAPKRQGQYVSHCLVYWDDIHELRAALDALGIEWR